ncbi:ephrin_rec_like domain-containing protein [Caerostris darwini]|uniref:Ephrin_rec_like domain-containing protein n=1 Tax=Caerostris darwini TaxID=1538125 RepID=A0AAV4SL78_9ARAC|nr:ephrin_rec_like domain-containing protein [Caerostris darwini]
MVLFLYALSVYELSGHKFVTTVFIDTSDKSKDVMMTTLKDLVAARVCAQDLCTPGKVKVATCQMSETKKEICKYSIAYEAIPQLADELCDEECERGKMFDGLKKAEQILQAEFVKMADNPRARVKADLQTFETRHLITCRGGFRLVKSHFKRCFPCLPGYYSEPNSMECNLCYIGFYQEHYGKHTCDKCDDNTTTETMGAKSKQECVEKESMLRTSYSTYFNRNLNFITYLLRNVI